MGFWSTLFGFSSREVSPPEAVSASVDTAVQGVQEKLKRDKDSITIYVEEKMHAVDQDTEHRVELKCVLVQVKKNSELLSEEVVRSNGSLKGLVL